MIFGILLLILNLTCQVSLLQISVAEDGRLNFTGLAVKYGMACEEHDVITEDGYILKVFHIPGNKTRPVLLMHGIFSTSDDFVLTGHTSISKYLSSGDYDIWAGNYRGNRYSRRHISLDPDRNSTFWNFGPHEHGTLDLAAIIDFILNKTSEPRLSLIGFSEGTMIAYVLGATRPEYNEKIKIFVSWAPISYVYNVASGLPGLREIGLAIMSILKLFKIEEILGYESLVSAMLRTFCTHNYVSTDLCRRVILVGSGYHAKSLSIDMVPTVLWHAPAGTSRKNLEHFLQLLISRRFSQYDYGTDMNINVYKSPFPPKYNLSKVTTKVAMFIGKNDKLSTLQDVNILKRELPSVVDYTVIEYDKFNHIDYVYSSFTHKILYPKVIEVLNKYNQ